MAGYEGQNTHVAEPVTREITVGPTLHGRGSVSPLQSLFLGRLARLIHQQDEWRLRVNGDDWRLRLIQHAIYSTYCDCLAMGLADHARDLVHHDQIIT